MSGNNNAETTIRVKMTTWRRLMGLKESPITMDELLNKLLDEKEGKE